MKAMFKVITIMISSYACLQSYYLRGIYVGYSNRPLCEAPDRLEYKDAIPLLIDPYNQLPELHFYASFLLLLFIIGQLIKREVFSQTISLVAIFLALLEFVHIYNLKSNYLLNEGKYFDLMRLTSSSDLPHIWLVSAVLVYQVICIFYYWFYERQKIQ